MNLPLEPAVYEKLKAKVMDHIKDRTMYLVKARCGADPEHTLRINVLCENAAQAVFSNQIFIKDWPQGLRVRFTVIAVPTLKAKGPEDGINSEAFVIISFTDRLILIGGTLLLRRDQEICFLHHELSHAGKRILPWLLG